MHDSFSFALSLSLSSRSVSIAQIVSTLSYFTLHKMCVYTDTQQMKKKNGFFELQNCLFTFQSKYEFLHLTAL